MPVWKWLIFIIFIVLVCGLSLFLFCAIKIANGIIKVDKARYISNGNSSIFTLHLFIIKKEKGIIVAVIIR